MKNRTDAPDRANQPTQGIDTSTYVDATGPNIRVTRPAFMTDEQWATLTDKVNDKFDELVDVATNAAVRRAVMASPEQGCSELAWCTMGPGEEHLSYHSSNGVAFGPVEPASGLSAWAAWPSWDRGASAPVVTIEGRPSPDLRNRMIDVSADDLETLILALSPAGGGLKPVATMLVEVREAMLAGDS